MFFYYQKAFKAYDTNKSGGIDTYELGKVIDSVGEYHSLNLIKIVIIKLIIF